MSERSLSTALADYLAVRRALGFKLDTQQHLLEQFVGFVENSGGSRITTELALAWTTQPAPASPAYLSIRLTAVRGFANWLQATDPGTEVPPHALLPPVRRNTPYLYSDDDIAALLEATRHLRGDLVAATYEVLIALLSVTGLRVGEGLRLDRSDLLLADGLLIITDSKFGKSRQLLLHPTTVDALSRYLRRRRKLSPAPGESAVFVNAAGNRVTYNAAQQAFRNLVRSAGLKPRSAHSRPTIHGLRHTFAVNTLMRWYRDGVDVQTRLAQLSTWLGHADPRWTYWYLSASPELLSLAALRLEQWSESRS
jgi:integrase/recombinase XerD